MLTSGGKLAGIVGSAGGRRIMPANSQIIFNLTRLGYDAREAVLRPRVDFSTVPVLVDRRLGDSTLEEIRRKSGTRVEYSELSLGRHSFASPIALWRMDGTWGCGLDPATVSSARAT
ncbi:MAG: gamma-glutamyltransferase family protein, partial [Candidatus Thermoplasmatota archaeon]|nr:gamma-glutamyltransferase family protein [Candidatus Thermoplasmatota archaeon]